MTALSPVAAFAVDGSTIAPPDPAHHEVAPKAGERGPDPYTLGICPITKKKLGAMGDPVIKMYDGREVRFCCGGCPPKFEKDKTASFVALDALIIADQASLYPLKTSVVTGKDLPAKPVEFVYGNRLVRVGDAAEQATFLNHAPKFMDDLDKAVIQAQGEHYPLTKCPVSDEALGGDMGETVNMIVGGRLVRLCCDGCRADVLKNPAKFVAMVDAARSGAAAPSDPVHTDGAGHGHHDPK